MVRTVLSLIGVASFPVFLLAALAGLRPPNPVILVPELIMLILPGLFAIENLIRGFRRNLAFGVLLLSAGMWLLATTSDGMRLILFSLFLVASTYFLLENATK